MAKKKYMETINLKKTFLDGVIEYPILKNINITISEGETTLVIGPSGAGKTTLLMVLALLDSPTSGTILFENKIISYSDEKQKQMLRGSKISLIFQDLHLIPYLSVEENIKLPLYLLGLDDTSSDFFNELVSTLDIYNLLDNGINEVSTGERQRVAIARTLISKPRVILADEPTGHLDRMTGNVVIELLRKYAKKTKNSVLIVSHDKSIAENVDRVLLLRDGMLLDYPATDDVFSKNKEVNP